jgi:hypoxanthine phosphoribosyltransferase
VCGKIKVKIIKARKVNLTMPLHADIAEVLLSEETIAKRVSELGAQITKAYAGESPVVICILKGASIFTADLLRHINLPVALDFMAISSYGSGTRSSGIVRISKDLDTSIEDRHVLVVEDIVDSGLTLHYLLENLRSRRPASVQICVLLDKKDRREVGIDVNYRGFNIPDKFVVGYGLDYAEKYRNIPYIGVLKPEVYS